MSKIKFCIQMFSIASLLVMFHSTVVAQVPGPNINCNTPGKSLQEALNSAPAGSTVYVTGTCAAGPYSIKKNLNLVGAGATTLSASQGGNHVLLVSGARVEIADLTVNAAGAHYGILVDGSSVYVRNIVLENAVSTGIAVTGASFGSITSSIVRNNAIGLYVIDASDMTVSNSVIEQNTSFGIIVYKVSSAFIIGTSVRNGGGIGVSIDHLSHATLNNTVVQGNGAQGIRLGAFYATVRLDSEQNTFQYNSPDVGCSNRGVIEVAGSAISATKTSDLTGCSVEGNGILFAP